MICKLGVFIVLIIFLVSVIGGCARQPVLQEIEITPNTITIMVDEGCFFEAVGISRKGEKIKGIKYMWSVDQEELGYIDENGFFHARKPGNIMVKATSRDISGEATVTIKTREVAKIEVQVDKEKALSGTTIHFQIKALTEKNKPAGFNQIGISSPTEGVFLSTQKLLLDEKGKSTFEVTLTSKPGPNLVIIKTDTLSQEVKLEGTKITRLAVTPAKESFEIQETVQFQAEGYDPFGNHRPLKVKWSLTGRNAELKDEGKVKMLKTGTGTIIAQYEDITVGHPFIIVPGRAVKIELEPEKVKLKAGQTIHIKVTGHNAYGHPLPVDVEWTQTGDLGSLSQDGVFLAKKKGTGTVTASIEDISATIDLAVEHGAPVDIRFKIEAKRIEAGKTIKLEAEGLDAFGNPFSIDPEWSLDTSLGTIDQQKSTFTGLYSGKGEITARAKNVLKGYDIEVVPTILSHLKLSPINPNLVAGDTVKFEVTGYDRFGNLIAVQPQFSMKKKLGELTDDGKITALKAGNTTLEAKVEEITSSTTLTVASAAMGKVVIEPEGPILMKAGKVKQFSAFGLDAYDNIVKSTVKWTLAPDTLGIINSQGVLTSIKTGHGNLIAKVKEIKTGRIIESKILLVVEPGEPVRIEIKPPEVVMVAGEEKQFVASVYDNYGNETEIALQWNIHESILGDIDSKGFFRAVKAGKGKIKASVKNIVAEAEVQIVPAEIAFLMITPETLSPMAGEKIKLEAVAEDQFGNVVPAEVVWKITDERLGVITADNFFMAKKEGQGFLVGAARNIVKKIHLAVRKGALSTIQLSPSEKLISSGEKTVFEAKGFDVGHNQLTVQPEWSIYPKELGSIDAKGVFTAIKTGRGDVVAISGGVKGIAKIEVIPGKPATLEVEPQQIELVASEKVKITLKAYDNNGNLVTAPDYRWQIDDELGIVQDTTFRAHRSGKGVIKIISTKAMAEIPVEVKVGKVHKIEVMPEELDISSGSQSAFSAKGYDQEGNEVELDQSWSIAGAVGTIDDKGMFTAQTTGKGYVICQMGNVSGITMVNVQPGAVSKIDVEPAKLDLVAGKSYRLKARAFDAQGNVTPATFSWHLEADEALGTFSTSGKFMAMKSGKGNIVAASGKINGYSEIEVKPASMARLLVSPKEVRMVSGEEFHFKAWGEDEFNNPIAVIPQWQVEPEGLGKISKDDIFMAQKAEKGIVKAIANGLEGELSIEIKPGDIHSIQIKSLEGKIQAGKNYRFVAIGHDLGGNVVPVEVRWAVEGKVGDIENNTGIFKATKVGRGLVVAYYNDIITTTDIEVKPGKIRHIFLEPNTVTLASNTTQKFIAKGLDSEKNSVPVPDLRWDIEGDIGVFVEPETLRAMQKGTGKVIAYVGELQAESYVTVTPGEPNAENSRLRVTHSTIPADGKTISEIMVEVRDINNNPVPGVVVKLISDRQDDLIKQPAKTNSQGTSIGHITSAKPGKAVITASIRDKTLRDSAEVIFKQ